MSTLSTETPPPWAEARGSYGLDDAVDLLYTQWRSGRQIVVLAGAGVSVQSGFPALATLGANLLMTYALQQRRLYVPGTEPVPGTLPADPPTSQTFSLERDGWSSPQFFPEYYGLDQVQVIRQVINNKLGPDFSVNRLGLSNEKWPINTLYDFARSALGLDWFNLLDLIAENRPDLVESLFDALGVNVQPGAAHNLLAQFVTWFNVRLILTTNFDNLIELSLQSESQTPYVFDVHIEAPPPNRSLIREHLSIIKLHGSHYGIRADRTINTPLDEGHLATLRGYFDDDAVLVVLDYSGHDARFMGLMRELMLPQESKRTIIRVDAIASDKNSPFSKLATDLTRAGKGEQPWADLAGKSYRRLIDIYYPHSRLFLLDVFQKCSGKLPNTRTGFSIIPHTPAPFKLDATFGNTPNHAKAPGDRDRRLVSAEAWALTSAVNGTHSEMLDGPYRFGVVTGVAGSGVSQFLSQVTELLFKTHQHLWCDLDEAVSVGTLVAWLYEFVLNRQPDHPTGPLPLDLPPVELVEDELGVRALARTASALWNRLKRDRYLIVIDSVSYALSELTGLGADDKERSGPRRVREAKRILIFLSMLSWLANRSAEDTQCVLLIGTHVPASPSPGGESLSDLTTACQGGIDKALAAETAENKILRELHPEARGEEIKDLIQMIIGTDALQEGAALNSKEDIKMSSGGSLDWVVHSPSDNMLFGAGKREDNKNYMRRAFVKVPWPGNTYQYTALGPDGKAVGPGGDHYFKGDCDGLLNKIMSGDGARESPLSWANQQNDERHVTHWCLLDFLEEMALCNRPRSWAQLLALPTIDPLAKRIARANEAAPKDADKDPHTRAVRALVDISRRCGALRAQPGGFYYMDGLLRRSLRPGETDRGHRTTSTPDGKPASSRRPDYAIDVHRKMLRYYERVYNLSGDVTAINYFYYHSCEYLHCVREDPNRYRAGLEELGRGLLENSVQARGHLNAYDHAYLLLRLLRIIKTDGEKNKDTASTGSLRRLIYRALSNIYEDADDSAGCAAIMQSRVNDKQLPPPPFSDKRDGIEYWFLKQQIHAQKIDLYRSCGAGLLGLDAAYDTGLFSAITADSKEESEDIKKKLEEIAAAPSGRELPEADITLISHMMIEVCTGFASKHESGLRDALVEQNRQHRSTSPMIHQIIIRLARTLIRLCCFSGTASFTFAATSGSSDPKRMYELSINLISTGKMLLASCADQDSAETKRLWTLYHCTRAKASLYSTTPEDYHRYGFSKDLYCVGLAKSYAIRAGGLEGIGAEGFASLQESEILIWEARMLMAEPHRGPQPRRGPQPLWKHAIARQGAAIRELAEARSKFVRGRVSLVRWREWTILLVGVSLDSIKVKYCEILPQLKHMLAGKHEKQTAVGKLGILKAVSDAAEGLERLGTQIIFQLPIVWDDDPWMEVRLWFQIQRLVFYAWGTLALAFDLLTLPAYFTKGLRQDEGGGQHAHLDREDQAKLVTAANRSLRALRLIGGYDTGIPTLPAPPDEDKIVSVEDWDAKVTKGLLELWDRVHDRIQKTSRLEQSGVCENSIGKIKEVSDTLYREMKTAPDNSLTNWKRLDRQKWVARACHFELASFGHGDI